MIKVNIPKLRSLIHSKGLKLVWFASKSEISRQFLDMILSGKRNPSKNTFKKICDALEVKQKELL